MGGVTVFGILEILDSVMDARGVMGVVLAPVFFFFVIFIHELGHAIGAWMTGYRVHMIVVGKLGFDPENKTFQKIEDSDKNEIAGFVSATPKWPWSENRRVKEIWVSFAGPLATILLGLGLLFLHRTYGSNEFMDSHYGFFLLAMVCFLDAAFNLFPLKLSPDLDNDGLTILKCLAGRSRWSKEGWIYGRLGVSHEYDQELFSEAEWLELRRTLIEDGPSEDAELYQHLAWLQSDPETFLILVEKSGVVPSEFSPDLAMQYVASRVLINRVDDDLKTIMPETSGSQDYEALYNFAKALLDYKTGDYDGADKAVQAARTFYQDLYGGVPSEEDSLFTAIETRQPLPSFKWPPLA